MTVTKHTFKIDNTYNELSGVCVVNIPFSIRKGTQIEVSHEHGEYLRTVAQITSKNTIKLIWFSTVAIPEYNISFDIERDT